MALVIFMSYAVDHYAPVSPALIYGAMFMLLRLCLELSFVSLQIDLPVVGLCLMMYNCI